MLIPVLPCGAADDESCKVTFQYSHGHSHRQQLVESAKPAGALRKTRPENQNTRSRSTMTAHDLIVPLV